MKRTYKGWAVKLRYQESSLKPLFVGRYWWFPNHSPELLPPQLEGHEICLFKTRREAREAINGVTYPRLSVVRVALEVREI